ncbi:MAG TPA: ClpX C4-type zinc finger protein [Acidimicrobiales bacterium]|nr:ClpX C4-type zinc finger protein [Acidimicrobiales bacterium]
MPTTTPANETDEPVIACCSFCFKPNTQVDRLVAGPAVYVCNQCVDLCSQVIAATPEGPVTGARMMPWEHAQTVDAALAHLPNVARAQHQVEESLLGWVLRARQLGATWAEVGDALGITRQSAWERFAAEE